MRSGLVTYLASKLGETTSQVKSAIMKAATGAYRMAKQEIGAPRLHRSAYFAFLKHALPMAWKIAREEHRLPTAEEVFKAVTEEWPNWKEELSKF